MKNQQDHWNQVHSDGDIDHFSGKPTQFAEEVLRIIPPSSSILELGCGAGNDSISLASHGHTVVATDFSEVAIQKCIQRFSDVSQLTFQVLDISQPFGFDENSFDAVYARLSLHYFTDSVTRGAFKEIFRVLKPNGYLCFVCKSVDDPLFGKGARIEDNMFELNGHVRHFFSEDYARSLLEDTFSVELIQSGQETFYDKKSAYVKVIARTRK